jgi:hypothetical protein
MNWWPPGNRSLARSREAHAVVIDDMPLYRRGVMHQLGGMAGIGPVELVEPDALEARNARLKAPALLVFGMPPDLAEGWRLLLEGQPGVQAMAPAAGLGQYVAALAARPGQARWLSRSASLATIAQDVRALLRLASSAKAPPVQDAGSVAFSRKRFTGPRTTRSDRAPVEQEQTLH